MKFFSWKHGKEGTAPEEEARMDEGMERLYQVGPPPADMPARFGELLAAHESPKPAQEAVRPGQGARRLAFAGAGGVMAAAAGLAVAAMLVLPGSGSRSGGVAEALQFLQAVPAAPQLEPGSVMHRKTEQWYRYGPMAEEIVAWSGVSTEIRFSETWGEAGPDQTLVRSYSRTVDGHGLPLQEDILRPGEPGMWRSTNLVLGKSQSIFPTNRFSLSQKVR